MLPPDSWSPTWVPTASTLRCGEPFLSDEHEIAVVRNKYLAILSPVAGDLLSIGNHPCILAGSLHFDHTARWYRAVGDLTVRGSLELIRREQPAVWNSDSAVFDVDNAANSRFQPLPDSIQEIRERRIIRRLFNSAPGGANLVQVPKVLFQDIHVVVGAMNIYRFCSSVCVASGSYG